MYSYEPRNLIEAINYDNGAGKEVTFGYNMAGQLIEMKDWNGTTTFTFDLLGQITKVNDHGGNITGYQYDPVGTGQRLLILTALPPIISLTP